MKQKIINIEFALKKNLHSVENYFSTTMSDVSVREKNIKINKRNEINFWLDSSSNIKR